MMAGDGANVPELRFPGFEGDWEQKTIEEMVVDRALERPMDGNHGDIHPTSSDFVSTGIPFVMANDIRNGVVDLIGSRKIKQSQADGLQKGFSISGDVLLTHKATIGEVALVPAIETKFIMLTPQVTYYRVLDKKKLLNTFLFQFFRTIKFKQELSVRSGGGTRSYIGITEQRKLNIRYPKEAEQQKIAAFFGAVDGKIGQLEKKKALLEDYKKGCMQKLFSRTLRFKDDNGNDFPDWEEKRLRDVFYWIRTNSLSRDKLTRGGGSIQNIHYGDIHTKFRANYEQSKESTPFVKPGSEHLVSIEDCCKLGDVVVADASEDYADIGKAIEIIELTSTPLVAGLHTYIARPKSENLVLGFHGYLMRSPELRKQIMKIAQGISVLGVSKSNLEQLQLTMPHPNEQQKIANFLTAIDDKITLTTNQLTQAQNFKKGLLQQMFV